MATIAVLDQNTIDKIAAGEVVERPASVVKELVENAMDAGATAITVEIRDGGISLVRITDNGSGIPAEQVPLAFLRHATSKIRSVEELVQIASLGFRGEALSSISAVAQVEMITKTPDALTGTRYVIEGGAEKANEEVGAPTGTTFLVRNIFYNTPARQKFLKTPVTEANAVTSVVEQLALSHPGISFKYMVNSQVKLHTSGNRNLKELVYNIYGRDIARELIEIHSESPLMTIDGFIGKPVISRGNRNFENYYVNGRYVRSKLLARAIEDGYQTSMMQHKYPFTLFYVQMDGEAVDVNVHPTKMELRFSHQEEIYRQMRDMISGCPESQGADCEGFAFFRQGTESRGKSGTERTDCCSGTVRAETAGKRRLCTAVPSGGAGFQPEQKNANFPGGGTKWIPRSENVCAGSADDGNDAGRGRTV